MNMFFTFVSPIYTFSLVGNRIVYTPSQGTNKEKYWHFYYIKARMLTLAGNKQLFHPSFPPMDARFSFFRRKIDGPNPSEMDIKMPIPPPTFHLQAK